MSRPFEPPEYDEPEVVLPKSSRLRRRFFFFGGIIIAISGLILCAAFYFIPNPYFELKIRIAFLGLSLLTTGAALAFGSLLVSPIGRGLGFFIFRFRPTHLGFLGGAVAACISWGVFFSILDNLERAVALIVAVPIIFLTFKIYKRNTYINPDVPNEDEPETTESSS
jgi:hypothetical protein